MHAFWALADTLGSSGLEIRRTRAEVLETDLLIAQHRRSRTVAALIRRFGAERSLLGCCRFRSGVSGGGRAIFVALVLASRVARSAGTEALVSDELLPALARVYLVSQTAHVRLHPASVGHRLSLGRCRRLWRWLFWFRLRCCGFCESPLAVVLGGRLLLLRT